MSTTPAPTVPAAARVDPWRTRPGWGIKVDLTPPEVIDQRLVARLRRYMGTGLLVLLVLVAGGFLLAFRHHHSAESAFEQEQATATALTARSADYADITQMQSALSQLQRETATLMSSDVRFDLLTAQLAAALPPRVRNTNESLSINAAGVAAATGTSADATGETATGTVDSTGAGQGAVTGDETEIGTATLTGRAANLDDVATYVERLQAIAGLTDVVPTSNASGENGVDYTITFNLTSVLLTGRFDVEGATP